MQLLIIENKNNSATCIFGPESKTEQWKIQEEGRFLELKNAYKHINPSIGENLEYWKNFVELRNYYGLAVWIDFDESFIDYLPLKTKMEFDRLVKFPRVKEKQNC
jgi:hypothetical protein